MKEVTKIYVDFYHNYLNKKNSKGTIEIYFEDDNPSLYEIVYKFLAEYNGSLNDLFISKKGVISKSIIFLIDDKIAPNKSSLKDIKLKHGSKVSIVLPISGG